MKMRRSQKGFTLIEILLVVAAIAILAGIVIVAINPAKQLAATRDAERQSEVNAVLNAVSQATLDSVSVTIAATACDPVGVTSSICSAAGVAGTNCGVDLDALAPAYLASLPTDPTFATTNTIGYGISTTGGRVTVCADAETDGAPAITVTR